MIAKVTPRPSNPPETWYVSGNVAAVGLAFDDRNNVKPPNRRKSPRPMNIMAITNRPVDLCMVDWPRCRSNQLEPRSRLTCPGPTAVGAPLRQIRSVPSVDLPEDMICAQTGRCQCLIDLDWRASLRLAVDPQETVVGSSGKTHARTPIIKRSVCV